MSQQNYRVLARAYRPQHFGELIGQDVLVRTLTNAIQTGRIAQAYMLTGVRGGRQDDDRPHYRQIIELHQRPDSGAHRR